MLEIRLGGSREEATAFLDTLEGAGCEVLRSNAKHRGDGFWQMYAAVRHPDYRPADQPPAANTIQPRRGRRG